MTSANPGPEGHPRARQLGQLAASAVPFPPGADRADSAMQGSRPPEGSPVIGGAGQRAGSDLRGIRRGMLALALLVVVLAIAIAIQSSIEDRDRRLDDAGARAMDVARAIEQHVGRLIDSNGQFLYDLRTQVEAEGGVDAIPPARLQFLVRAPRLYDEATRRVFIADAQGNRTAIADGAGIPASVAGREYFVRHRTSPDRGVAVDAPFRADGKADWVMPISVRLDDREGRFAGVAVLSFDVDYLMRYLRARELPPGGSIALVATDGRFFVRYPEVDEAARLRGLGHKPAFANAQGVTAMASPFDGSERIVAYHRIGDYPLYAVVALSRDEVLREWMRGSLLRVALAGGVTGMAALFAVLLLARLDAQRRAQESLARFERAVDQAGDMVYWVGQDGRIAYLNETAARRFSEDRSRIPAQLGLHDIVERHAPAQWKRTWDELARRGTLRFESRHVSLDGNAYPVEVSASPIEVEGAGYAFLIVRESRSA